MLKMKKKKFRNEEYYGKGKISKNQKITFVEATINLLTFRSSPHSWNWMDYHESEQWLGIMTWKFYFQNTQKNI